MQPVAQAWTGPVRSSYGLHYVWVEAIEPEREATLDEVRVQLLRDLESQARREALQASIAKLRENYFDGKRTLYSFFYDGELRLIHQKPFLLSSNGVLLSPL